MIVRSRHQRQGGFTLIELMVAMTVGLILMTVLTTLFLDSLRMADIMLNQAQLNRQAREMFDLLALGGYRRTVNVSSLASSVTDPTDVNFNYVFGLRGRKMTGVGSVPTVSSIVTTPGSFGVNSGFIIPTNFMAKSPAAGHALLYQLALSPSVNESYNFADQGTVLLSDQELAVTLTCTGANVPVDACASPATVSVAGYLRIEPAQESSRALPTPGYSVETLALDLINARYYDPTRTMEGDVSSVYWNAFTNLID